MTNNQINYAKLKEDQRHNVVTERIGQHQADSSRMQAYTGMLNWQEQARHNRAGEQQARSQLQESIRHNVADESYNLQQLAERKRSAQAQEAETNRHNLETESVQRYSALENVRLGEMNARSQLIQAQSSARQADTAQFRAETDLAKSIADINLNTARQREVERSNLYNEALLKLQMNEQQRHNLASEKLTSNQQREAERHNVATETQAGTKNQLDYVLGTGNLEVRRTEANIKSLEAGTSLARSIIGIIGGLR